MDRSLIGVEINNMEQGKSKKSQARLKPLPLLSCSLASLRTTFLWSGRWRIIDGRQCGALADRLGVGSFCISRF
jgi:hypothetical protein